jgi:hypothetical protein
MTARPTLRARADRAARMAAESRAAGDRAAAAVYAAIAARLAAELHAARHAAPRRRPTGSSRIRGWRAPSPRSTSAQDHRARDRDDVRHR